VILGREVLAVEESEARVVDDALADSLNGLPGTWENP
jgi:hypothetical protein